MRYVGVRLLFLGQDIIFWVGLLSGVLINRLVVHLLGDDFLALRNRFEPSQLLLGQVRLRQDHPVEARRRAMRIVRGDRPDPGKTELFTDPLGLRFHDVGRKALRRSEERRVGKEWGSTFRSRWSPDP